MFEKQRGCTNTSLSLQNLGIQINETVTNPNLYTQYQAVDSIEHSYNRPPTCEEG